MQKEQYLLAIPGTGAALNLTDETTIVSRDKNTGIVEFFNVNWSEKELKKPKKVPNTKTFAGYAEIGTIIFVSKDKPKVAPKVNRKETK